MASRTVPKMLDSIAHALCEHGETDLAVEDTVWHRLGWRPEGLT